MADNGTNKVEELVQAYNQAVSSGIAAMDAGMAQTTAAVKLMTNALQTERTEYGKVWEAATSQARRRNEDLIAMFPNILQGMTAAPGAEAKESVNNFVESDIAFSQAWMKGWMVYLSGLEIRSSAATQALLEGNAKTVTSGHEAVKSAVKYGEAIIDWSLESAKGTKS